MSDSQRHGSTEGQDGLIPIMDFVNCELAATCNMAATCIYAVWCLFCELTLRRC